MNGGPAPQSAFGFPPGMHDRIAWRDYGALRVGIVDRAALICLKLHAAVDNAMHGRHVRDLLALNPTDAELHAASEWVKTQDAGSQFSSQVDQAVAYVRAQRESSQR
jgi:hypothetical protein